MSSPSSSSSSPSPSSHGQTNEFSESSHKGRIVVAWLVVGIPLAYGVSMTLVRAAQLFTG